MSEHCVTIREATLDDVDAVVRLTNAGGPDGKPRRELPRVLPEACAQAFATIDSDPCHLLMVADLHGIVVGTFHLVFLTYLAGGGRHDAQLEAIHVAADHRRKGIGTQGCSGRSTKRNGATVDVFN